jgi:hypothetical protein
VTLADPFGGSGTTFLESQKFENYRAITSDLAPIYKYVLEDNVRFFSLTEVDLLQLQQDVEKYLEANVGGPSVPSRRRARDDPGSVLTRVWEVVSKWIQASGTDFLDLNEEVLVSGFEEVGPELANRIVLYTALRASARGLSEIERGTAEWMTFFRRELENLLAAIGNYAEYLEDVIVGSASNSRIAIRGATYSKATMPIEPDVPSDDLFSRYGFEIEDVSKLPVGAYDLIVTDPPYGFNTDEQRIQFGEFMAGVVPGLVNALKPTGGQLVLACPEVSFSGRSVLPFVRSDFLTREVMRSAAALGRECVVPAMGLPRNIASFRPPYYWVAEKTLRRRILHFWIRPA